MGFFDLHEPEDGQDRFFLYAMIILPFCSSGSYLFDSWYHYQHHSKGPSYEGLLSTIMIVFSYLQYCTPIRSRKALAIYYILLCIIKELATIGYLLYYIHEKEIFKIIFYSCFLILDLLFTSGLIYCRVMNEYESRIVVENKHLFHFMSRLEVILTIYIPVFMKVQYTSLTRHMIAYFLLFDFFSDSYSRFQGIWIKSALYLFATTTTISVATEWFYFNHKIALYEEISYLSELFATILSDLVCRVRYTNVLPDLPFDPKFLRYPFSQDRFVRYKPTSLEKNYRWDLLTEHDVGVEIDLINPDAYATTRKITEEDERLLEEETASPANLKRSLLNQRSVPWLRKTEYISTEQSSIKSSLKLGEVRSSSVKEKLREDSLKYLTKERLLEIIEEGFETAKAPVNIFYNYCFFFSSDSRNGR
ncbi:unnamed protein product [Rotaria sp. Silwood2]|nr:unnamed protein product [Rotaria sp. Silwood2]